MRIEEKERGYSKASQVDGVCTLALTLEPYEAYWLVFDPTQPCRIDAQTHWAKHDACLMLDGAWQVHVDANDQPVGAQHQLAVPGWLLDGTAARPLASWLEWDLKQFSGFVDYRRDIEMDTVQGDEVLDLGELKHMAELWVNDQHVGVKLWPPYTFDVGQYLQPGSNRIHVKVGNLILNAVTQYPSYNWKWHSPPTDEQLNAGMFGPVCLRR